MFWRGVIGYLPANVVQALVGFGAIVVFTRLLSPAQFGDYALGFSVSSLIQTCLFTWIEAAMARFYAAEPEGDARRALYATLYRAFAAVAVIVPLLVVGVDLLSPVSTPLKSALAAGAASTVVRSLLRLAQERRRAAGRVRGFVVFDVAQSAGGFLVGVLFARAGWGGAAPLIGSGLASAACLLGALPQELRGARGGRFELARLARYAAYGLPITLSLVLSLVIATTDRFVLAAHLDAAAVGAYHAGYSLSSRTLDVMFVWLGMAGGPAAIVAFERGGTLALRRVAHTQAQVMIVVALPAAAGLALVARPLAGLMIGPALQHAAGRITPWIAAGALCSGLSTYYLNTAFVLSRRTGLLLVALACPALANLGLTLWLIPAYGLDGAMWATTASYALGLLTSFTLGRRCLALPVPWSTLARAGAATALMALALARLPVVTPLRDIVMKVSVGVLVYGGALWMLDAGDVRSWGGRLWRTARVGAS